MPGPDRLKLLNAQNTLTGLDFVYVHPDQMTLDVYFLTDPSALTTPLVGDVDLEQVTIYQDGDPTRRPAVRLLAQSWQVLDGRNALRLIAAAPGGFENYRLRLDDPRLDRYFNDLPFSFKAACPSDLDCAPGEPDCPPEAEVDFPVDYRARDFWSYRRALLDFAAQRYPDWPDRLEADAVMMLLEAFSAVADEMAYYQDAVGREAWLETAAQRRSLRRHARLVDYTVHDGLGSWTWVDFSVLPGPAQVIPAGAGVWALSDAGERIDFEVGRGLAEAMADPPRTYAVDPNRNSLQPHAWDEDDACLPVGATEMFVKGHLAAALPLDDPRPGRPLGRWVLLKTDPADRSIPARRWMVRLVEVEELTDPLVNDPLTGPDITRLRWEPEQALPFELDLRFLEVRGNLLPATAGRREVSRFAIGALADEDAPPPAVERQGPNGSVAFLFSLPESDQRRLVYLPARSPDPNAAALEAADPRAADPEVHLVELAQAGGNWVPDERWVWRRSLVGVDSSQPEDRHFTLDDGTWRRVVGFRRIGTEIVHTDYASGEGVTLRFGDGEFGMTPPRGTLFQVTYRLVGGDADSNLPADSIRFFDPALNFIEAVYNPLPSQGGQEPERPDEVRLQAPEAFRYQTFRAVRPEDYAEAAERLEWVQRAGAAFRWTGSWLSALVTPDPRGAAALSRARRLELEDQLDRFRQAGREAHVLDPTYADIDLEILVCVEPFAYPGEVEERVLEALTGRGSAPGRIGVRLPPGFFSPDRFTFGQPLLRPALEAAIQAVPGVRAVEGMRIRRRGWFDWRPFDALAYEVGPNEIVRIENNPLFPGRGSLRLDMHGGA